MIRNLIKKSFLIFLFGTLPVFAFAKPVQVVTSVSYLKDIFNEVTCEASGFEVDVLIPSGIDPHTYQLTTDDRRDIEKADVFLFIGMGFEPWLLNLQKNGPYKNWFEATKDLKLRSFEPTKKVPGHDHALPGGVDVHIWHSPDLTLQVARRLADFLSAKYPMQAANIKKCKNLFESKVRDTRTKLLSQMIAMWPQNKPKVIALNHDALGYFAEALGFKIVPLLGFSTTEQLTPQTLKTAIAQVKKMQASVVFFENTNPSRDAQNIAKQLGLKFGGQLYADGLGPQGSGAETTFGMWMRNFDILISGVK